ncbi:MAG: DegT/DnrJ/EryC1/StrS aminotransferase family protein [Bacteroidetes bacterium]|nr:DegT/DnrJ/EryC1/StrS aminotransferase family protein [Bacteroidota bacterium]
MIPITKPYITETDIAAVTDVLKTGMLVQGENVLALEQYVGEYLGNSHVVAVSNGTATMHIMLKVNGISAGDEVIVPAFSYIATANVVELVGATPIFVDINLETFNIDISKIEEKITPKTKAILSVHEFGLAANIEAIQAICTKHNLVFLEDAACALGAEYNGSKTGTFGQSASFSLHPRKAITSGEGGLIVSGDKAFIEKCKILRNHGVNPVAGHTGFTEAGFNYRMTDFQAALVLSQFKRFQEILDAKQAIAKQFLAEIKNSKLTLPKVEEGYYHSWQSFHIILNGISQVEAIAKLKEAGIAANYGAQCIPHMDFYKNKYNFNAAELFPNAFNAWQNGLVIPLYPQLNNNEIEHIIHSINQL